MGWAHALSFDWVFPHQLCLKRSPTAVWRGLQTTAPVLRQNGTVHLPGQALVQKTELALVPGKDSEMNSHRTQTPLELTSPCTPSVGHKSHTVQCIHQVLHFKIHISFSLNIKEMLNMTLKALVGDPQTLC